MEKTSLSSPCQSIHWPHKSLVLCWYQEENLGMQLELNHHVGVGFSGIPFVYLFVHHPFSKH